MPIKKMLTSANPDTLDAGRLILRIGIGCAFLAHGYPKITGGPESWHSTGLKLNSVGFDYLPTFFGFLASCAEFFGGIFLIIGFIVRPAALFLMITMIVALAFLISKSAGYADYSDPLELIFVFLFFLITGPDKFTIDRRLSG